MTEFTAASRSLAQEDYSQRVSILFSNGAHTFTHLFTVLYATAVLHLPSVFDVPFGELLGLSSVGLTLYGFAALPAGWLGDRWSQVGMMVVFFIGVGVGACVTGMATGVWTLFLGLTLIGLFGSIYHPVGIAWLVACAKKQGMALGINGVFGSVGSALAPIFVGLMIDFVSWRAAFYIPGIASIIAGFALLVFWRAGVVSDRRQDHTPSPTKTSHAMRRVFVVLTLTMMCNGLIYTGVTNTVPKIFELGLGERIASSYTEIGFFVGLVIGLSSLGSFYGGWLADRYSARTVYLVFWVLLAGPLFMLTSAGGYPLLCLAFLVMLFNVSFGAAENLLVAHYTPFKWRSLAYGAKFVLALGIGGATVQLAGYSFDATGSFDLLYTCFGAAAVIATVAAWRLPSEK